MIVIVGSKNPVKVSAVREAFEHYYKNVSVVGMSVSSGVSDQPFEEDTHIGAKNRAEALLKTGNADYYVGVEGGCFMIHGTWMAAGSVCILDNSGREGRGVSPAFPMPPVFMKAILEGREMGVVADEHIGSTNIKQQGGTAGYLTRDVIPRKELYIPGIVSALVPFLNEELYFDN